MKFLRVALSAVVIAGATAGCRRASEQENPAAECRLLTGDTPARTLPAARQAARQPNATKEPIAPAPPPTEPASSVGEPPPPRPESTPFAETPPASATHVDQAQAPQSASATQVEQTQVEQTQVEQAQAPQSASATQVEQAQAPQSASASAPASGPVVIVMPQSQSQPQPGATTTAAPPSAYPSVPSLYAPPAPAVVGENGVVIPAVPLYIDPGAAPGTPGNGAPST